MAADSANASERIVVALSGGVDSSTAAAMLHAEGHALVGFTMQLWNQRRLAGHPGMPATASGRCCSLDDVHDARRVAEGLGIPYYVVNYEDRFERDVVAPFVAEYLAGRTPIPCSHCNTAVKFDEMARTARQIGAGKIATGHYARVRHNAETDTYELLRAVDRDKDQTFFLWGLTQEQLSRALFPLGELHKAQVRALAERFQLPVANKPESYEICFVPGKNYQDFVAAYLSERPALAAQLAAPEPGEVVTREGQVLARHHGVHGFTVGQRKGLGVATGEPLYVIELRPGQKQVVVGDEAGLLSQELTADKVNWIAGQPPAGPLRVEARIRNRHVPAPAWAEALPDHRMRVRFDEAQRAITPGQAVVLYQDERVLGGGWIE